MNISLGTRTFHVESAYKFRLGDFTTAIYSMEDDDFVVFQGVRIKRNPQRSSYKNLAQPVGTDADYSPMVDDVAEGAESEADNTQQARRKLTFKCKMSHACTESKCWHTLNNWQAENAPCRRRPYS